jgi:uncharacterized Ntn-hydrolase superfamily protein
VIRCGTYSIVARDDAAGQLGVAVQSHWFSVGSVVTWGRAGVGVVATQSIAEPAYGPRALALLESGVAAGEALRRLLAADEQAGYRQVAVMGVGGPAAVHTGADCIPFAGHEIGDSCSAQANLMAGEAVWPAMVEAFERSSGPLARRLLAALEAGEAAGGDVRGRQSAALLVVPASGDPWDRVVELRVEDDPDPLGELARLLTVSDAYALATEGDDLVGQGRHAEAGERYRAAAALAPANDELLFWAGLAAAAAGDVETALRDVDRAIELHPGWRDLLDRLTPDIAPGAPVLLDAYRSRSSR